MLIGMSRISASVAGYTFAASSISDDIVRNIAKHGGGFWRWRSFAIGLSLLSSGIRLLSNIIINSTVAVATAAVGAGRVTSKQRLVFFQLSSETVIQLSNRARTFHRFKGFIKRQTAVMNKICHDDSSASRLACCHIHCQHYFFLNTKHSLSYYLDDNERVLLPDCSVLRR